jgi:hypothetical protein
MASESQAGQAGATISVGIMRCFGSRFSSASATEVYRCLRPRRGWTNTVSASRQMINRQNELIPA